MSATSLRCGDSRASQHRECYLKWLKGFSCSLCVEINNLLKGFDP